MIRFEWLPKRNQLLLARISSPKCGNLPCVATCGQTFCGIVASLNQYVTLGNLSAQFFWGSHCFQECLPLKFHHEIEHHLESSHVLADGLLLQWHAWDARPSEGRWNSDRWRSRGGAICIVFCGLSYLPILVSIDCNTMALKCIWWALVLQVDSKEIIMSRDMWSICRREAWHLN